MPLELIFHIRNAFAFHGFGNNDFGLARRVGGIRKLVNYRQQVVQIVPINLNGVEADGLPGGYAGGIAQYVGGVAEALQSVLVNQNNQVIQAVLKGEMSRFPGGAFVGFTVGHEHKHPRVVAQQFARLSNARTDGQAVPQRTRCKRNARMAGRSGVGGQRGAVEVIRSQFLVRNFA